MGKISIYVKYQNIQKNANIVLSLKLKDIRFHLWASRLVEINKTDIHYSLLTLFAKALD